jgi:hypothetical protein
MFSQIFNAFYNNSENLNFIKKINNTSRGIKLVDGMPKQLANGISFNFYKNKISLFKLYCEVCRKFNEDEVLKFLPYLKDYSQYIDYWDKDKQSGLCIGFKLNRQFQPINYFHIKFGKNYKFKNVLIDKDIDTRNHDQGISYEYMFDSVLEKKYIYFRDKDEIKFLLNLFSINEDPKLLNHIEYTETQSYKKVILIYDLVNFKNEKPILGESPVQKRCIDYFRKTHNLLPVYRGKYDTNIHSYYWSLTNNRLNNFINIKW